MGFINQLITGGPHFVGTKDVQASQHPVNDQVKLRSRLPQTDPEK